MLIYLCRNLPKNRDRLYRVFILNLKTKDYNITTHTGLKIRSFDSKMNIICRATWKNMISEILSEHPS